MNPGPFCTHSPNTSKDSIYAEFGQPLSPRQREMIMLAAQGLSRKQAAARLGLSPQTVKNHLQEAYAKLGVNNIAQAVFVVCGCYAANCERINADAKGSVIP